MRVNTKGIVYVLSAPSGTGKTSIIKSLVKRNSDLKFSVSHTTRARRRGEKNALDYYFVDVSEFQDMVDNAQFVEHAEVHGSYYGTTFHSMNEALANGSAVLEIDWQGARQVRKHFANTCSIFILPPSHEELRRRLLKRDLDAPRIMENRLQSAVEEMAHWQDFDHLVVNEDFHVTCLEIKRLMRNHPQGSYGRRLVNKTLQVLRLSPDKRTG